MSANYAVFIRHGDYHHQAATPGAFQPFPLTVEGETQAVNCVEKILAFGEQHGLRIAPTLHSSIVLRAWSTAEIIRRKLADMIPDESYSLMQTDLLCERSVGSLANLPISAIEQVVSEDPRYETPPAGWKSDSHYRLPYPGAESLMQAGERVSSYINQVMSTLPADASIMQLFIGHGAAFRHAACDQAMLELDEIKNLSMFHAEPIYFTMGPDKGWRHRAGEWKIRSQHSSYTD